MSGPFFKRQTMAVLCILPVSDCCVFQYLLTCAFDCRHEHTTDNTQKVFSFSLNTGSSTLCTHLFVHHISMWVDSCNKFKIPITAANAQELVASYRMSKGQCTSQSNPGAGDRPPDMPEYSYKAFVDAITECIIADDQVSIHQFEAGYFVLQICLPVFECCWESSFT